jgi:enoyl-[acyl-carrier protein] reductase I
MGLFDQKKGIVMGVANEKSLAAGIAKALMTEGAQVGVSFLPDLDSKMEARCRRALEGYEPAFLAGCNVGSDESLDQFFDTVEEKFGAIDFLVHSIAYAPLDDIRKPVHQVSRQGFNQALELSCYSFVAAAGRAAPLFAPGASLLTLTYFGGERVVPGYNLMGLAKAALESSVKYLAYELGEKSVRVNALSAGPVKTLASSAVGDFGDMLGMNQAMAPLGRNITLEEVAQTGLYLLGSMSSGVTGEVVHVDGGYHVMGAPGRALDRWNVKPRNFRS